MNNVDEEPSKEAPQSTPAASAEKIGGKSGHGDVEDDPEDKKLETRRSLVRIIVTYIAAGFLFLGGGAVVAYLFLIGDLDTGKDIFLTILPVSAAIVTYWFAGRKGDDSTLKILQELRKRNVQ